VAVETSYFVNIDIKYLGRPWPLGSRMSPGTWPILMIRFSIRTASLTTVHIQPLSCRSRVRRRSSSVCLSAEVILSADTGATTAPLLR